MKRIAVFAGDYYHPFEQIKKALDVASKDKDFQLFFHDVSVIKEVLSERPDAVILYKENRIDPEQDPVPTWMTDEAEEAIVSYVNQGGSWFAWHTGMASYETFDKYTDMIKGWFIHHPPILKVTYTPIDRSFGPCVSDEFSFDDEHYFVECRESETNVFLKAKSESGETPAGWAHLYGQGKVCALTPAHLESGLLDPAFQQVLTKCIEWLLTNQ